MDDHLSTKQVGWLLGRSANAVRGMIRDGEIEAMRIPGGFRVPRDEVLRVSRETIQERAGRDLTDSELEGLVDEVLATNDDQSSAGVRHVKQLATKKRRPS